MATTCLESSQLAVIVFGAIFGTLVLCGAFLFIVFYWARRRKWVEFKIPGLEGGVSSTSSTAAANGATNNKSGSKSNGAAKGSRLHLPSFTTRIHPLVSIAKFKKSSSNTTEVVDEGDGRQKGDTEKRENGQHPMKNGPANLNMEGKKEEYMEEGISRVETARNCPTDFEQVVEEESQFQEAGSNGGLTVYTSTPKKPANYNNTSQLDSSTHPDSEPPPSLPSGSPPHSSPEKEGEEEGVSKDESGCSEMTSTFSNTPIASPKEGGGGAVRFRQQQQPTLNINGGKVDLKVDEQQPSNQQQHFSSACTIRMGMMNREMEEETPTNNHPNRGAVQESNYANATAILQQPQASGHESGQGNVYSSAVSNKNRSESNGVGVGVTSTPSILSAEQCGTLEANRKRLEREHQQLRQLGII